MVFPGGERFYTVVLAAMCWAIWNIRNRITFESKRLKYLFEIIFLVCANILYWAGLQKEAGDAEDLKKGAEMIRSNAKQMMRICGAVLGNK